MPPQSRQNPQKPRKPPDVLQRVRAIAVAHQTDIERTLGARRFACFVHMAWHWIDPAPLLWNWHIDLIADALQSVAARKIGDTVICVPPRHMKSMLASVLWQAWIWTWWPAAKFITASYDLRLAARDSRKCRQLVEGDWYQARWGRTVQFVRDQNQKLFYETVAGGYRYTCSPTSGVTGHGADFATFDDPHNVVQGESESDREAASSFWFEAMPSRLNDLARGRKVVIQQRVHQSDVAGKCIARGYHKIVLPALYEPDHPDVCPEDRRTVAGQALWPQRFPKSAVEQLAREMGQYQSAGQLFQRPAPREGGMFKPHWFAIVEAIGEDLEEVRRWDLAGTESGIGDPDWTAGVKMGRGRTSQRFYILDVARQRLSFAGVEALIKNTASADGPACRVGLPIDPGQAGKGQYSYLVTQLAGAAVEGDRETGSKVDRARPFSAQAEVGNVRLLRGAWNRDFLDELAVFPNGRHDDQVDAASGAMRMLLGSSQGMLGYYRGLETEASEHRAAAHV